MKFRSCVLTVILLLVSLVSNADGWQNPMTLGNQEGMGIGDPYILKYRGVYYLYSSTDNQIHCWTSKDLVTWTNAVIVCSDAVAKNAYAPEVKYWNGKFYMCTSPAGNGHYILTSDSPTGPFVHQTDNLGYTIDGSIFIDDDGSWYFYHAGGSSIMGNKMSDNHLGLGSDVNLGACMDGQWTEGPGVFKRNGIYYMLYTGNHVLTNGYRIDYAVNTTGPIAAYTPQNEQNPILLDTETTSHIGLGHGSAFIGPDLDSYYFCYHCLNRSAGGGTTRSFNLDRIGWNGDKLMMYGPTNWRQDAPSVADNDYFNRDELGDNWTLAEAGAWSIADKDYLSQTDATAETRALLTPYSYSNYTAEFTVRASSASGMCGAVFSYTDDDNYATAMIDAQAKTLKIQQVKKGTAGSVRTFSLPSDFDPSCWHSIRIEKNGNTTRVYVDGMRKYAGTMISSGGCIGYATSACKADFSYIAISQHVDGSGILDVNLPVPGIIAASHCAKSSDGVKTLDQSCTYGTAKVMSVSAGEWLDYNFCMQLKYNYNIGIRYKSSAVAHIRLVNNGETVADNIELPASSDYSVYTVKSVPLVGGRHDLKVEVIDGEVTFYEFNIRRAVKDPATLSDDFESGIGSLWRYKEGTITASNGQMKVEGCCKALLGTTTQGWMTDYTVECDIKYTSNLNAGILFRTTNPSTGGANDSPSKGSDFVQGYFFTLGSTGATLGKHNYNWTSLASKSGTYTTNRSYHLKVVAEGSTFKCYVDNKLVITYTDPVPFIEGRCGVRSHNCTALIDNFVVTPSDVDTAIELPTVMNNNSVDGVRVYNTAGQMILNTDSEAELNDLPRGIYVVDDGATRTKILR